MILKDKNAVLYGVSESLGGAMALALSEAGAKVFLTAHRLENARKIADDIRAAGGRAEADEVDALDEQAVNHHADRVVKMSGTLDVSFNLINISARQGTPLVDMSAEDFVRPVRTAMLTQFLTATAAGRIMSRQRSGVVLSLTATPGGIGYPMVGGFGPACCAIEAARVHHADRRGGGCVAAGGARATGRARAAHQRIAEEHSQLERLEKSRAEQQAYSRWSERR
jgi:3-oxoacyl-[acyl-carrier protein] reductase